MSISWTLQLTNLGTAAFDIRTEDAAPDEVRTAPDITRANLEGVL